MVAVVLIVGFVFLFSRKIDENQEAILVWGANTNRNVKRIGNKVVLYDSKYFSQPVEYLLNGVVIVKVLDKQSRAATVSRGQYFIGDEGKPKYKNDFQKQGDLYIIKNR